MSLVLCCVCKVHVYMFIILNVMKKNGEFFGLINLNAWLIKLDFCKIRIMQECKFLSTVA